MTGFPGESEAEFDASLAFAHKIGFEKIHVFPYSSRPGTKAAALPQLSKAVKEERARRMREAADDMRRRFLTGEMGKRFPVLFETTAPDAFWRVTRQTIRRARMRPKGALWHSPEVTITGVAEDGCTGILNK